MRKPVLILLSSIVLMTLAASTSWAQSCNDCIQIPRKTFELAKKAADEAEASRTLIDKQAREIDLLYENKALQEKLIASQQDVIRLHEQREVEKDIQIASEKGAREKTEQQLKIETKEKEKAQRSVKFWRRIGTIAGAAAGVLVFGAIH